jgi:hypothetical protein
VEVLHIGLDMESQKGCTLPYCNRKKYTLLQLATSSGDDIFVLHHTRRGKHILDRVVYPNHVRYEMANDLSVHIIFLETKAKTSPYVIN